MKATGIVRRIDDLGRVVIPKEIRRTMRIREGEPLEIFTEKDGGVIFKKYSPIGDITEYSNQCAEALNKSGGYPIVICDKDSVIAVAGLSKRDYVEKPISTVLSSLISKRKEFAATHHGSKLDIIEGMESALSCFSPIIADGDVVGAVISINDRNAEPDDIEKKLVSTGAMFLSKQIEL